MSLVTRHWSLLAALLLATFHLSLITAFGQEIRVSVPVHPVYVYSQTGPLMTFQQDAAPATTGNETEWRDKTGALQCWADANGQLNCVGGFAGFPRWDQVLDEVNGVGYDHQAEMYGYFLDFNNIPQLGLENATQSICIGGMNSAGDEASCPGTYSVGIGQWSASAGLESISLGGYAWALADACTAIGYDATCTADNSIAIGSFDIGQGEFSIGIGPFTAGRGTGGISIGYNVYCGADWPAQDYGICIGTKADIQEPYNIAIGYNAGAHGANSIAMGLNAYDEANPNTFALPANFTVQIGAVPGVTDSGTTCTITAITGGIITGGSCI